MSLKFQTAPDREPVEFPTPTTDAEKTALQVVIEAAQMCDAPTGAHLPEDSPMTAALRDFSYALAAVKEGTTPNIARCGDLLSDAFLYLADSVTDTGAAHVDSPTPNLHDLYDDALRGREHDAQAIATQRERFRRLVIDVEKLMDAADAALAAQERT